MSLRVVKGVIILLAALLLAVPGMAEEGKKTDNATDKTGEVVMPELVVTATRTKREAKDIPSAVTVITREEIEDMAGKDAIDVLKNAAGVEIMNARGSMSSATYNKVILRGMGYNAGRVLVLIDGMPTSDSQSQAFEWSLINRDDIERIEIVRGPSSALYGGSAMGGVVNIITRKAVEEGFKTTAETSYGSHHTWIEGLTNSGRVGKFGYRLSGKMEGTGGYNTRAPEQRTAFYQAPMTSKKEFFGGGAVYDVDDTMSLNLDGSYAHFRNRGKYTLAPDLNLFNKSETRGRFKVDKAFGGLDTSFGAYATYTDSDYDTPVSSTNTAINYVKSGTQWEMGGNLQASAPVGDFQHLTGGVEFKRNTLDSDYDYTAGRKRERGGTQDIYSLFGQDEMQFFSGALVVVPGVRFDYWRTHDGYDLDTDISNSRNDYDSNAHPSLTPKIGVRWNLPGNVVALRAAYGEAFRAPSLNELYGLFESGTTIYFANPNLDPEKSQTFEAGLDLDTPQGFHFSFTGYRTSADDYIAQVTVAAPVGYTTAYEKQNVDRVEIVGMELDASWQMSERFKVFANHVWTDPVVKGGQYDGKKVTGIPLDTTSYGFLFNDARLFTLRVSGRTVGDINYNSANTQVYGNYTTFDAKISRSFDVVGGSLEAALEGTNLTDTTIQEMRYDVGPGRAFMGTLKYTF
jgi:outer membrane cobalamin receptor